MVEDMLSKIDATREKLKWIETESPFDSMIVDCEHRNLGLKFSIWGACPLQAEGVVGTRAFYFGARHQDWDFYLGPEGCKQTCEYCSTCDEECNPMRNCEFHRTGHHDNASWMYIEEGVTIILKCVREFLREQESQ